jgi:hypothetical protein
MVHNDAKMGIPVNWKSKPATPEKDPAGLGCLDLRIRWYLGLP